MTVYGRQLVDLAATQRGKRYRFGKEVQPGSTNYYGTPAWDCSELVEGTCRMLGVTVPDGAVNQFRACNRISVADAVRTPGALLFAGDGKGAGRDAIHHVAFSRGDGRTEEARNSKLGVGSWSAAGRFQFGGLILGVDYGTAPAPVKTLPTRPTVKLGERSRAAEILNWELHFVTGADVGDGGIFDWPDVTGLQNLEKVLKQEWGDCTTTTPELWAALDYLALPLGQLVKA